MQLQISFAELATNIRLGGNLFGGGKGYFGLGFSLGHQHSTIFESYIVLKRFRKSRNNLCGVLNLMITIHELFGIII